MGAPRCDGRLVAGKYMDETDSKGTTGLIGLRIFFYRNFALTSLAEYFMFTENNV